MTAKKSPSTLASKSTELTDATKSKVSTLNPDCIMKSDNSINSTSTVNSDNPIDSGNAVNSTTSANADNLFDNEQTVTETTTVTAPTEQPKQQHIGKQQRKSDFAEFKATFLAPSKLVKRHPVNIEDSVWEKLERPAFSETATRLSAATSTPSLSSTSTSTVTTSKYGASSNV